MTIFVEENQKDGMLKGIFIKEKLDENESKIITARKGKLIKTAMKSGFTEPDPKIDLSGTDVARKILILSRESGLDIEFNDIINEQFLPMSCLETKGYENFIQSLIKEKNHFNNLLDEAINKNERLKYVAEMTNGKAKVSLKSVNKNHPFYNLEGSDNIVLFYTMGYYSINASK